LFEKIEVMGRTIAFMDTDDFAGKSVNYN